MTIAQTVDIGPLKVGAGHPHFLIAGPCVIENERMAIETAVGIAEIAKELGIPYIFKSSYDKANRTSISSFRGLGQAQGLAILKKVQEEVNVPVLTDAVVERIDLEDLDQQLVDVLDLNIDRDGIVDAKAFGARRRKPQLDHVDGRGQTDVQGLGVQFRDHKVTAVDLYLAVQAVVVAQGAGEGDDEFQLFLVQGLGLVVDRPVQVQPLDDPLVVFRERPDHGRKDQDQQDGPDPAYSRRDCARAL